MRIPDQQQATCCEGISQRSQATGSERCPALPWSPGPQSPERLALRVLVWEAPLTSVLVRVHFIKGKRSPTWREVLEDDLKIKTTECHDTKIM